jgi:hypothetical protein
MRLLLFIKFRCRCRGVFYGNRVDREKNITNYPITEYNRYIQIICGGKMGNVDCEKLKQNRDDAYTQLVLVQIESKDNAAKKGILGLFNKKSDTSQTDNNEPTTEGKEIQDRLEKAKSKYEEAKRIYEENCKG